MDGKMALAYIVNAVFRIV